MACLFACLIPSITIFLKFGWELASFVVFTFISLLSKKEIAFQCNFPLKGGFSSKLRRQVKKGLLSPTTITFDMQGRAFFIQFSIRTGVMFSPPAVIISSLALPVMKSQPFSSILPRSPERTKPYRSIVLLVSSGFFKYPIITFRPLRQIYPSASLYFYFFMIVSHPDIGTPIQ